MAQQNPEFSKGDVLNGWIVSFVAEAAISKNMILELGTAYPQVVKHTTTATTPVLGVALDDASANDLVACLVFGPIKLLISDAAGIARGQVAIASNATAGSIEGKTYADGATLYGSVGIALDTADAAGELVPVICGWPGVVAMS